MYKYPRIIQKILAKDANLIERDGNCQFFTGIMSRGRPTFWDSSEKKLVLLHKRIYEEVYGEIPPGYFVVSKCGNKNCIAPVHLKLISIHERNVLAHKNRNPIWKLKVSKTKAVLDEKTVKAIIKDTRSNCAIARDIGVDKETVRNIKLRKSYKHINNLFVNL